MKRLVNLLIIPILAVGLGWEATAATPRATAQTHVQAGHVSDSEIDAVIRMKLAKSKIGKDGFRFHVAHGVVTWEGTTRIGQHKGAATRMARTSGATQVINNIQVVGGKPGVPMKKAYVQ
jgi:hypothetical protein